MEWLYLCAQSDGCQITLGDLCAGGSPGPNPPLLALLSPALMS